jgi:Zn-dependent M28 family amino/carboxypeptidase
MNRSPTWRCRGVLAIVAGSTILASGVLGQVVQLPTTAIDIERVTVHVKVLASDAFEGRAPGTPAESKTVDYIIRQFQAAGLDPGGDPDGKGARKWTQDVPLAQSEIVGPVAATLNTGTNVRKLRQGEDIAVRATYLPIDQVSIKSAPIVFVGYGVTAPERDWDDFKNTDIRGKIGVVLVNDPDFETDLAGRFGGRAMTYYGRWTYKFEEAARRGAAGMLVVHETAPASYGWPTVRNSNTSAMFDILRADPGAVHPLVEGWIQRDVAVELFKNAGLDFELEKKKAQSAMFQPLALPSATFSLEYRSRHSQIVSKNVVGRLAGTTRADETILYTAHWDHLGIGQPDPSGDRIYNGARDNALGLAGLLELARIHAAAPRVARSIVFLALTAEERGLLGSEYYAQHPLYPLATTAGVYNMDGGSVGGPSRDVAVAGDGNVTLQNDLAAAAARQGRRFSPDPQPQAGSFFRSDHFPFAKAGVPAISFRVGLDRMEGGVAAGQAAYDEYIAKHYHQPSDEWSESWDLRGFAIDTGLLYELGRDLAASRRWPEWLEGSEFKARRDATSSHRN